jgi:hypothetical protein
VANSCCQLSLSDLFPHPFLGWTVVKGFCSSCFNFFANCSFATPASSFLSAFVFEWRNCNCFGDLQFRSRRVFFYFPARQPSGALAPESSQNQRFFLGCKLGKPAPDKVNHIGKSNSTGTSVPYASKRPSSFLGPQNISLFYLIFDVNLALYMTYGKK